MLPTGLGLKALLFYVVLMAAFFAAPYMNLFFLLLSFLSVVGVLAVVWTWRNLAGVEGSVVAVEPTPAGTGATVVIEVRSRGRRPRFALDCVVYLGRKPMSVAPIDVLRGERRVRGALPALSRGVHRIHRARLQSKYPFGFLLARRAVDVPPFVVVHPAPTDLGKARTRTEMLADLCGPAVAQQGDMGPSGLREYRDGDELRHVNWKASARRNSLVVREWDGTALAAIEVCIDLRSESAVLEESLSLVTALSFWARDHKELLVVHAQGHRGTYGESHRPWVELLTWLASVSGLAADGPPPPVTSPATTKLPSDLKRPQPVSAENTAHA